MTEEPLWRGRRVLAFACQAGAGDAVGPVVAELRRRGADCLLLSKDAASASFARQGLDAADLPVFSDEEVGRRCVARWGSLPDVVFTSATSLPSIDMTERYLWRWASGRRVPSAGLVDQWQNYALRFSGVAAAERLAYLPDIVLLMDDLAVEEAVADGLPRERLRVSGQPAFDARPVLSDRAVDPIRAEREIDGRTLVVAFIAESLKKDFGTSLGYDEDSVLAFLSGVLIEAVKADPALRVHLIVKLHPENERHAFDRLLADLPVPATVIAREHDAKTVISAADLVVGIASIVLIHAIVMGKPTVSLELDAAGPPMLVATRVGAVPFLRDRAAARTDLLSLLGDPAARARRVERQRGWTLTSGISVPRVLAHLQSLISEKAHV
jgi:hypothetical protein